MKFSLVWYTSLFAAVLPARGDDDRGASAPPAPPDWGADGRPARVRRQPRLVPTDQGGKTVVIVGAGYAGWGAAHRLVEGGMAARDITILEADDTFGGRARKDEDFMPYPLDLGPSYIPDLFHSEVAELAGVVVEDLPLVRVAGAHGWYLWQDGMTYYDFMAKNIIAKLDLCESKEECRKQAKKKGFDFRGQHSEEGTYGCYSKPNQNKAFWGGGTDEQDYTTDLSGNRERINCDRVQKEYGCWVTSVDYEGADHVETTCDNGKSFTSTQVIVTVPLSVLKDGDIAFTPDLPAKVQQNVDERDWFRGFKVFVEFDTDFSPRSTVAFGGKYDRHPDTGLITGEHLLWDYTRYCKPEFVGRRNLVGGYFVGSKADDFDGMDEAQIVEEVLKKFAEYYTDEDGYTRGYRPDSYRRHLLVHWENPAVKPFVRGTYSGPSRTFAGHRADSRNKLFIAGEAFPAPIDEFCRSPEHCHWHLSWAQMSEEIREAYAVLGWSQTSWDTDSDYPDTEGMLWDELTGEQREAAAVLGYTQASWDGVSAKADATVTYESEGWVYAALHSGQKAAEMILALQGWSDLFAAEDFGTFGATLGVFDACGKGDKAREAKDNFFLELKARDADSCARTRHFDVSSGATKIRIAFKLKAVNFENGDFFSLDIATNGGDEYTQVLTAGIAVYVDSGTLGSVVIPQNKKWFNLGKLLEGDRKKWLVVKLADWGTGSVESISLRFTNHAAHENNQKVHLDDVSLQEFVPM